MNKYPPNFRGQSQDPRNYDKRGSYSRDQIANVYRHPQTLSVFASLMIFLYKTRKCNNLHNCPYGDDYGTIRGLCEKEEENKVKQTSGNFYDKKMKHLNACNLIDTRQKCTFGWADPKKCNPNCHKSHTPYEMRYHPEEYKTQFCRYFFFSHAKKKRRELFKKKFNKNFF
ncbi:hypothetical protein RFI_17604 [Reticulomyxa filosa]|uniref:Uncharacterized protein n=1 Tax=Reticulomyxa filosa TaxID=46433 RepID=X6N014_RETFI|nr:hypothetical protein RFI_17604 [Reticulomyxa filosa]|eukprot:ETO19625.1 hypothetical protein RFI_17604 [Reticulomyxa filosa]